MRENTKIIEKASDELEKMMLRYNLTKEPFEANFRKLVDWLPHNGRSTHFIHPYPAKLLMHIPNFFLTNDILTKENDLILDIFCGSGTTLLEANINNRKAIGLDINPIAALISKVKTTVYDIKKLHDYKDHFIKIGNANSSVSDVVNIDYWFDEKIKDKLGEIKYIIDTLDDSNEKDFARVCFSNCIRKLSNADPHISVPVKLKLNSSKGPRYNEKVKKQNQFINEIDVHKLFSDSYSVLLELVKRNENEKFNTRVYCHDARSFNFNSSEKFDLIITSPPYAGAQKYVRATSLNLGWLDYCPSKNLNQLDKLTIGREQYKKAEYSLLLLTGIPIADQLLEKIFSINPLRAYIAANYLLEMKESFRNSISNLKENGYLVLVIGNNIVCGLEFNTQLYLELMLNDLGLSTELKLVDTIKSRGLMTKRNKTANVITCEWIILFKKNY